MKRKLIWYGSITVLVVLVLSGWIFYFIQHQNEVKAEELTLLQTSFNTQYGTDGIKILQFAAPDKVYAASWTSKDGATHISWNIGGIWVTVYNSTIPLPEETP
jgi:hypothetical protein